MSSYETEMSMILDAARFKMKLNAHKGNIEDMNPNDLGHRAKGEIDEMMQAFDSEEWEKVVVEAGDALNFIIGVVSKAMDEYRNR